MRRRCVAHLQRSRGHQNRRAPGHRATSDREWWHIGQVLHQVTRGDHHLIQYSCDLAKTFQDLIRGLARSLEKWIMCTQKQAPSPAPSVAAAIAVR